MPGSRRKHKNKLKGGSKPKTSASANATSIGTSVFLCCTLEEDEVTRCGQPATEGHPKPDRCKVHHGQYRIMYQKYKDASKVVDEIKQGAELPTKDQIGRYTDWHTALEKARCVREYLEAIRVEKTGREIHQKRFILKVDEGHKYRLKLLHQEMVKAVDAVDALQARAFELYRLSSPLRAMEDILQSTSGLDGEDYFKPPTEKLVQMANPQRIHHIPGLTSDPILDRGGDEDLIELSLLDQRKDMIAIVEPLFNFELFASLHVEEDRALADSEREVLEIQFFIQEQFARRIILNEPTLFMKALDKVSFKDLVFSDNFSMEDLFRFMNLFMSPLGFPLRWFKDAVLDALAMSRYGTAANVGSLENRFPLLGGWVFNRAHTTTMSNEAWWYLLKALEPPGNMENRFVRLCNNFDDLIGFLSFGALGYFPSPAFCDDPSRDFDDPSISRKHLSLSGVIVTDMVGIGTVPPQLCGPLPTMKKSKKHGYVVWAEFEHRAYMFGAVSNDPDDPFTNAFIRELRARPDLFQVVLRSETAPGHQVETFGSGPSNNQALPAIRMRNFEAPPSFSPLPSPTDAKWDVPWSAKDVLYGSRREIQGYLTLLARDAIGWFFRFKTFPAKYFVILDTVPNRDVSVLARNVSWAALRAGGYGYGEYTLRKYAIASDKLFEKCANERLGWLPKEFAWKTTKMEDQLNEGSLFGRCSLM